MNSVVPILLVLNAAVALALAVIGERRRPAPGARPFAIMLASVSLWSCLNALQIVLHDPNAKRVLAQLAYVCIVTTIVSWWACCAEYAGRAEFVTRRSLVLVALPGLASLVLVALGPATTLMFTEMSVEPGSGPVAFPPGPWFTVHSLWAFTVTIGGLLLMWQATMRAPKAYRPQFILMLVAIVVPLGVNTATIQTGALDTGGHDLTPIALLASSAALGLGVLRFSLLDLAVGLVPVAHDAVVESMRDGIVIVNSDGKVLGSNPAALVLLGRPSPPPPGSAATGVLPRWTPESTTEIAVVIDDRPRTVEVSSSPIAGERGHVITLRDVTEARAAERALRESLEQASYQARHDHLTGLPNRRLLFELLEKQTGAYALAIVDLDGFKAVNDSYGHSAGDAVLVESARRLKAACRPDAVVARLGGDEFAVLLPDASYDESVLVSRRVLDSLATPIAADGHHLSLTASAGVALAPRHGRHSDELVRAADIAMYAAKRARHHVAVFGDANQAEPSRP